MRHDEIAACIVERLAAWGEALKADGATPLLVVGIRHNEHLGKLVLHTLVDLPDEVVGRVLVQALQAAGYIEITQPEGH